MRKIAAVALLVAAVSQIVPAAAFRAPMQHK